MATNRYSVLSVEDKCLVDNQVARNMADLSEQGLNVSANYADVNREALSTPETIKNLRDNELASINRAQKNGAPYAPSCIEAPHVGM